ncbi:hypothetical protein EJB05_34610, partial [Eragrostis curvula]
VRTAHRNGYPPEDLDIRRNDLLIMPRKQVRTEEEEDAKVLCKMREHFGNFTDSGIGHHINVKFGSDLMQTHYQREVWFSRWNERSHCFVYYKHDESRNFPISKTSQVCCRLVINLDSGPSLSLSSSIYLEENFLSQHGSKQSYSPNIAAL